MISDAPGTVAVLNTLEGDMRFSFNSDDPLEVARAERCVEDMLQRGYILFVEVRGKMQRVLRFDKRRCEYIIADGPMKKGGSDGQGEQAGSTASQETGEESGAPVLQPPRKRGRPRKSDRESVSAKSHRATGIPRTAGG